VSKGKGNYFKDWEEFEKAFVDQFCPKDEQLTALTKLEGTRWYQGKDPVDDYIDRFQELIDLAEYNDDKTIVIKFRRGLDPTLQNQVALLGDGAPDFDDPEGWYKAARKVSRNREANEAFVETSRWTSCSSACSAPTLLRPRSAFVPIRRQPPNFPPPPPVRNISPPPSKNRPAPMDIDHARGKGSSAVTCFRCRKAGHYARECPQAFDICLMTTAEKLELLLEFLALADVIGDSLAESPSESSEHRIAEAEEAEDFAIRSR
jgi:Retrotransposon gag protein/Zinc knuckle